MANITRHQLEFLCHSLGLSRSSESYRNYYAANPEGDPDCDALVATGLMERGRDYPGGIYYHVTDEGIELAHRENPWRVGLRAFEVSASNFESFTTIWAKNRGAARYEYLLTLRDAYPNASFADIHVRPQKAVTA